MHARVWVVDRTLAIERFIGRGSFRGRPLARYIGASLRELFAESSAVVVEAHLRALDGHLATFETDDEDGAFHTLVQPRYDPNGEITGVVAIAFDLIERKKILGVLARSEETLAFTQTAAHLGHWTHDFGSRATTWSDELFALCGETRGRLVPVWSSLFAYVHRDDRLALEAALEVACEQRLSFAIDTRLISTQGQQRWVQHRGKYVYDGERRVRAMGTVLDITSRRLAEHDHARHVWFDDLTSLPNRPSLVDRLEHAIALANDDGRRIAVLSVDLDRFKRVNASLGHAAGDDVLRAVAGLIAASVGRDATVGRIGGDEFVILQPGLRTVGDAARLGERVVAAFARPILLGADEVYASVSVGISLFPDDARNAEDLLRLADVALGSAKRAAPGALRFYSAASEERAFDRLALERELRHAFEREAFSLEYQPIVDRHERIVALEALLRFRHPVEGPIDPERFIPLCEEIGIIVPLGRWVVRESLARLAEWRARGLPAVRLAINVSARQILDPDMIGFLADALDESGCSPNDLELEITESFVIADIPGARRLLRDLKRLGVRISLDDFGTGYSALSYLKHFDVDALKIDRAFVRDLPLDRGDAAIVSAVVALGHAMGLTVVAEGIERIDQADFVRRLGVDEMQGFHFGRPVSAAEIEALLRPKRE